MESWKNRLQAEFSRAEAARRSGNEGQARVCARRAAGIAIREYFARRGRGLSAVSVMDLLQELSLQPDLSPALQENIEHLGLRVDAEFQLPRGVDLLEDARALCEALLPGWQE